uniref:Kazal-like domain-containing protein n=1 Tax=Ascaris lumbricoides TaxID=6252 RepID=A0A0M3HY35_ASCLU
MRVFPIWLVCRRRQQLEAGAALNATAQPASGLCCLYIADNCSNGTETECLPGRGSVLNACPLCVSVLGRLYVQHNHTKIDTGYGTCRKARLFAALSKFALLCQ